MRIDAVYIFFVGLTTDMMLILTITIVAPCMEF